MNTGLLLMLIVLLPLAAALLGYALRKRYAVAGYLCIVALLASAVLSIVLLNTPFTASDETRQDPALDGSHHVATLGVLNLPGAERVPAPVQTPEDFAGYRKVIGRELAEQPPVWNIPLQLRAGKSQLLFTTTTALIALLCLLFALWERRVAKAPHIIPTLTLFTSAMLLFLCADTLLLVYISWELMGLCSFLLIASPGTAEARRSAREAFWTTRATDFGLLLAIIVMLGKFGWTALSNMSLVDVQEHYFGIAQATGHDFVQLMQAHVFPFVTLAALLILLAVIGKTALLPLSFWLPGAMVAPAPVSALLHAATMVAAGPYLLLQVEMLLSNSEVALVATLLVAGVTMLLTGLMALSARDAKQVLAYSTISQLCIPVLGAAVFAPGAALLYLLAHAWFKAPLFLAVGYLAHQHGSTALTTLAGSARRNALVLTALVLGGLALAGVAYTGGFFGKEQVLLALLLRGEMSLVAGAPPLGESLPRAGAALTVAAVLMLLSIPVTAAYTARLIGILGWGRRSEEDTEKPSARSPSLVLLPTALTALLGVIGVAVVIAVARFKIAAIGSKSGVAQLMESFFPGRDQLWRWISEQNIAELVPSLANPEKMLQLVLAADIVLVLTGIGFAWLLNVARPASGARAIEEGVLAGPLTFFASGMHLREFWLAVVGHGGALLAALAGRGEARIDEQLLRTGRDGRRLAVASSWVEQHIVDGLRYWGAEVWWVVRRWHQRFWQTGSIQHYMFVILASAVLLCFLVLPALAKAFGEILGRM